MVSGYRFELVIRQAHMQKTSISVCRRLILVDVCNFGTIACIRYSWFVFPAVLVLAVTIAAHVADAERYNGDGRGSGDIDNHGFRFAPFWYLFGLQ